MAVTTRWPAQVDLDAVYDPDPAVFVKRVTEVVEKVGRMGATHVFLQACPDPDGSGFFRAAWFQNHQVPVRADIWSMVAHKFRQAGVRVWIRAPSMNLTWIWEQHPEWRIPFRKRKGGKEVTPWYFRLSPDLEGTRKAAIDLFTDIAVYLPIQGVLDWRPECRFGRNTPAPAVEKEGVHPGYSQDFGQFLKDYDLTVVMAYARMEGHVKDAEAWAESLARRASRKWVPQRGRELDAPPGMPKFHAYALLANSRG